MACLRIQCVNHVFALTLTTVQLLDVCYPASLGSKPRLSFHTLRNLRVGRHRVRFYAPNRTPRKSDHVATIPETSVFEPLHALVPIL